VSLHPQYARARDVAQTVEILDALGSGAVIIAGGQELMPHVNHGRLMPSVYVDINGLQELRSISETDGVVAIGALTVHRDLQRDAITRRSSPLLAHAAAQIGGGWQVHNRGTVGGNLTSMHPLYDLAPSLIALGAQVEVSSVRGTRTVLLSALIAETSHGLGTTALITRVKVPSMGPESGWSYLKLKVTEGAYGSVNVAAIVTAHKLRVGSIRLVVGAASERPVDCSVALQSLVGRDIDAAFDDEIAQRVSSCIGTPLDDHQGDSAWRREVAGVLARRAIREAVARSAAH
jgi:aerobic carbon-monoxide dehydrogenase medium subunit